MNNDRFSIAPKNMKNNISLQSNVKEVKTNNLNNNNNRKSSSQVIHPRATTFSSLAKLNDPRPIKEGTFQEECITKICDFLIKSGYDRAISKHNLVSPQAKDFTNFFTYTAGKIRPDWKFTINKLDEDLIPLINEMRYPGYITKSHLIAVGAPNTWPHLLALLAWMVELANYMYEETIQENTSSMGNNMSTCFNNFLNDDQFKFCKSTKTVESFLVEQEKIFELNYKEFLHEGFKQVSNKGDCFNAIETFQKKTNALIEFNFSNCDKSITEKSNLENQIDDLEKNYPSLSETKLKMEILQRDLNSIKMNLTQKEKKLHEILLSLESKDKEYEQKSIRNKELVSLMEEVDSIVKTQKVTFEDFEKLKHNKTYLEKQFELLNIKKTEQSDLIWNLNNDIEIKFNMLNQKIKYSNLIVEKLKINKENYIDILSFINNSQEKILNPIDFCEVTNKFNDINSFLINEVNLKIFETKEREESHINLKSELRKFEDKFNEANELLSHKHAEYERENNVLQIEKDKFIQLINQKNEEIKKFNNNIQVVANKISEREKEIDDTKNTEMLFNSQYKEEEEQAEIFIKELEKEYEETFHEVGTMKTENICEIRKNHRNILAVFENIKNQIDPK